MRISEFLSLMSMKWGASKNKRGSLHKHAPSSSYILPGGGTKSSDFAKRIPPSKNIFGGIGKLGAAGKKTAQIRGFSLPYSKVTLLVGVGSLFVVLSSVYYWIFESKYFLISSARVIIESLDPYADINRAYESIGSLYGTPLYLVDKEQITELIKTDQIHIQNIEINRLWPNGLQIIINSQKAIATLNFLQNSKRFYLSQSGVIMSPDPTRSLEIDETLLLPVVFLPNDKIPVTAGKRALRPVFIDSLRQVQGFLSSRNGSIGEQKIVTLHILEEEQEIHLVGEKLRIMLSVDKNLATQLSELSLLIAQKPEILKTAIYLDMRVPRKAFSCQDPIVCQGNIRNLYPKYTQTRKE